MIHKAWNVKKDLPYCFSRSSVKFQGHTSSSSIHHHPSLVYTGHAHHQAPLTLGAQVGIHGLSPFAYAPGHSQQQNVGTEHLWLALAPPAPLWLLRDLLELWHQRPRRNTSLLQKLDSEDEQSFRAKGSDGLDMYSMQYPVSNLS